MYTSIKPPLCCYETFTTFTPVKGLLYLDIYEIVEGRIYWIGDYRRNVTLFKVHPFMDLLVGYYELLYVNGNHPGQKFRLQWTATGALREMDHI